MSEPECQDLQLFYDECLGSGSYGKVCKAKLNELPCAAKILHIILFQFEDPRSQTIRLRFEQECNILRNTRHPNVVQYLGVAHDPRSGLPILLMELLDGNLTNFLEDRDEPLPYHLQVNLWHDIALALTYLHSKHIIHRDLSGNNVLLIAGNRAKVTDFGMSKFSVVDASMSRLTQCPGTPLYMSPEALRTPPIYTDKLDVFSAGVVAVQIITQKYPAPGPDMLEHDDPGSPSGVSFTPIAEVERRKNHIDLIDPDHPMLPVIQSCLRNKGGGRPSARQLCQQLATLKQAPDYMQSKLQPTLQERKIQEQEKLIQGQQEQLHNQRHRQQLIVQQHWTELAEMKKEKQELEQQTEKHIKQIHEWQQALYEQQHQAHNQQEVIQEQQKANQQMQTQITESKRELQVLNTRLHKKSQELQLKKQELWRTQYSLRQKTEELQQKREELQQETELLQRKTEEFQEHLHQALHGQCLQEFQVKITGLELKLKENQEKERLIEQLPPAFVARFTAEELPHHMKKHIEEDLQEWEENLCKFQLFCGHLSSGYLIERNLEIHRDLTLGEVTERAYKVLELQSWGVQLEQCQFVRYYKKSGTLGKPFDVDIEIPFGEVVGGPQSCFSFDLLMEIQTDPATLPRHEQEMRATRVIFTNYSLLWQHLDASKVLPKLVDTSVISESKKKEVESYRQSCAQNAAIVLEHFYTQYSPEGLLTICETLQTTPGKEHIAQQLLRDYKRQPQILKLISCVATGNAPLLSEVSLQFQTLQQDVVDLLVQCPNALTQLKQCLASLVLPLGEGKVASLVDPGSYDAAETIPEFFRLMAPYWNCLSTSLFALLIEASGCKPSADKLAKFEEARASSCSLVLCACRASTGELRSIHRSPLERLQLLHPDLFAENEAAVKQHTARITAQVGKLQLHVSCYEEVTTAICGFFRLPKAALVYAGCSENPLALCWLVSRDLLPYMKSHKGGLSGDRILAEQQITQLVFGDAEFYKCPNHKGTNVSGSIFTMTDDELVLGEREEIELLEASFYSLLERIPTLLTSVSVDTANSLGSTPLYLASQEGHIQVAELLLQAGASVDQEKENGQTALYIASDKGNDQIVELLLKTEAHVNHQTKDGATPLWAASFHGYHRVVKLLLEAGANSVIQKDRVTPLYTASFHGHKKVVELLMAAGANPAIQKKDGQTALYIASYKGHDQIVELLLRREANVNHQIKDGRTSLWAASFKGHQRVVELLLGAGANSNIQEEDGWTPLHGACHEGHAQVAELLLQAGANVEEEMKDGQTALFVSSYKGHDKIVELLLRREANVNYWTKYGTPLTIARSKGHEKIVQLLLEANRQRTTTQAATAPAPKSPATPKSPTATGNPMLRLFKLWKS